jgi:DNA polymerase-4
MDLPLNYNKPLIMHVDLNSCFAIIEQQANPLIRHKPVGIAAYDTPGGMIIASSYEAKALGINMMSVREARLIYKDVIVLMPDPDKYFDAHRRFKKVLLNYTDAVTPKSVDEFIVDFSGSKAVREGKSLEEIGLDIKKDIKESLGEYVTVNIGIATNRFLAKLAAGLHKPDGRDVIEAHKLRDIYAGLKLTDLPGINVRYEARLNVDGGIYTPLQFLDAPLDLLKKRVFKSVNGLYWYMRLRGHEIDAVDFGRKSFGQQYAIGEKTKDKEQLSRLLMKLCEKCGRRLRGEDYVAGGIHLWLNFENRMFWAEGKKIKSDIYSTQDIYRHAQRLLNKAVIPARATNIGVTVFNLRPATPVQLGLFDDTRLDTRSLARAADIVNDRYGEFTLVPATMANMQDIILKRVAFGSVRDL